MNASERAIDLVNLATSKFDAGKSEEGVHALRQAVSLAPENRIVREAFERFSLSGASETTFGLCVSFVRDADGEAGKRALLQLRGASSTIPDETAVDCFRTLLSSPETGREHSLVTGKDDALAGKDGLLDDLVSTLLQRYRGPRLHLTTEVERNKTLTLESLFSIGSHSANELITVLLNSKLWSNNDTRQKAETDCFQWFLLKTREQEPKVRTRYPESKHEDKYEIAVTGASRLLSSDAECLKSKVDALALDTLLLALNPQKSTSLHGPVTVALARYFDVAKEAGHDLFRFLITDRISRLDYQKSSLSNDLIVVLSMSSCVFLLIPSVAASIFLTENFVPNLVDFVQRADNSKVNSGALRLLSAACIDGACRLAISQHCKGWLHKMLGGDDFNSKTTAATVLAMVQAPLNGNTSLTGDGKNEEKASSDDVYKTLRDSVLASDEARHASSIEGLAYVSLQPTLKERIVHDKVLLSKLLKPPGEKKTSSLFGSLTLINNLAQYLPTLSEEQKRVSELKAYANASKPASQPDSLDKDDVVARRCAILLAAGVVPYLAQLSRDSSVQASPASLGYVSSILLSISRNPKNRGTMAQQGSIAILLQCYKQLSSTSNAKNRQCTPAHALARILISVDPKLVFGSRPPSSAVGPLLSLIQQDDMASDGPRDMLPLFEGLLALTNLVSDPSFGTSAEIMRSAFPRIEELLLDNNPLIQRATTELICNLMTSPEGLERFADGSRDAARRLHIMVALTDVDDVATRRGASGALAMITEFEGACKSIVEQERGVKILLDLCGDEDGGCKHRGVVCVRNLVLTEGEVGQQARTKVKELGGVEIMKKMLKESREQAVLETAVETLKAIL